jgi:hypothetical protein
MGSLRIVPAGLAGCQRCGIYLGEAASKPFSVDRGDEWRNRADGRQRVRRRVQPLSSDGCRSFQCRDGLARGRHR